MPHSLDIADRQGDWRAPNPLARQRVIERIGALDRTVRVTGLLTDSDGMHAELLPTIAVLITPLAVALGSVALADAEIGYRRASVIDPLIGLLNRQALATRFEELCQ